MQTFSRLKLQNPCRTELSNLFVSFIFVLKCTVKAVACLQVLGPILKSILWLRPVTMALVAKGPRLLFASPKKKELLFYENKTSAVIFFLSCKDFKYFFTPYFFGMS